MELTDYQKRDAHIVKYLKYMIAKCDKEIEKFSSEAHGKRSAYKDILFKMTKTKGLDN